MKILMVTPYYYPIIGGVESVVENVSVKLNELGIQTDIMTFNYGLNLKTVWKKEESTVSQTKIIRMPAIKLPRPTFFVNHITKNLSTELRNYDILHFHNETDLSFPLFSYGINKPRIIHCHVLDTTYYHYLRNPAIKHIFTKLADIFVAPSNFISDLLLKLRVPEEKIRILPNGIDVNVFREGKEMKSENLLLFVGRLDPKKGLDVLLDSLKQITTPVELVIAGPTSAYEKYSNYIIKKIEASSKTGPHKIRYVGRVDTLALIEWYQRASLVIMPSIHESFGMVNMESLACGTPVVATNVGAIPEVVRDYETGLLVPPADPKRLATAIQYLLDNEAERLKFGKQGRKWIVDNYSTSVTVKHYVSLYNSLLKSRI